MKIQLINHASFIIESGEVILLNDPWFFGACFAGGWGLRYHNPDSFEMAKRCTHLWISHFHGDHFHVPTLKKLLEVNPDIVVIGNHSFNFQLDEAAQKLGFKHVISFQERQPLKLGPDFVITRYPTTGIDNMLYMEVAGKTLLNFNDCNLPERAIKGLKKKIGRIDVLLNNYNHAGKLLEFPLPTPEEIRQGLIENFVETSNLFEPQYILPFASHHYYRAPESQDLNDSMLTNEDLVPLDARVLPLSVGEELVFDQQLQYSKQRINTITYNELDIVERPPSKTFEELQVVAQAYAKRMRKAFLYLTFWIPDLILEIKDLGIIAKFSLKHGLQVVNNNNDYHITTASQPLYNWFNKIYGIDSFWVGAHFDISKENFVPLRWQLLIGLLTENRLDLTSLIKMVFSIKGLRFLKNRREEIIALLLGFNFNVGSRK